MKFITREISILAHGVMFFTRIPVKILNYNADLEKEILRYFSFLGLLLGLFQASLLYLFNQILPFNISLLLMMAFSILLSGAFHEDGLADTFDALWGGSTVEKREKILKDSTLGTYGVIALIIILLLKFEGLKLLTNDFFRYIIIANVISRFFSVVALLFQSYSADAKSKSRNVMIKLSSKNLAMNLIIVVASSLYFLTFREIAISSSLIIIAFLLYKVIKSKMGFLRGDFLGAIQQIIEVYFYLLMLIKL